MRRVYPQFPLRTLLTLVLAVACFFGGRVSRNQELAEARREIQALQDGMPLSDLNVPLPVLISCDIPNGDFYELAGSQSVANTQGLPAVQITLEDICVDWPLHCNCKH